MISQKDKVIYVDDKKLVFYHFHALEFYIANSKIIVYEAAAGYKISKNLTKLIYMEYTSQLRRTLLNIQKLKLRKHKMFSFKFVKSLLRKRISIN